MCGGGIDLPRLDPLLPPPSPTIATAAATTSSSSRIVGAAAASGIDLILQLLFMTFRLGSPAKNCLSWLKIILHFFLPFKASAGDIKWASSASILFSCNHHKYLPFKCGLTLKRMVGICISVLGLYKMYYCIIK